MTVRELIAALQEMPQDYTVAYQCYSDYSMMQADEIKVRHASDKKAVRHHNMPDEIREYNAYEYAKGSQEPEFVNVVIFPGN